MVVIMMGRNRMLHACRIASVGDLPSMRCASSAKSIIMMPFFFTSPTSMMMPKRVHGQLDPEQQQRHERAEPGERRSEEHTSELQSLAYLVCRLLLEKKKRTYDAVEV